ncbi:MAG: hypothetical protein ACREIA_13560 [Opitutaceae bacterium]
MFTLPVWIALLCLLGLFAWFVIAFLPGGRPRKTRRRRRSRFAGDADGSVSDSGDGQARMGDPIDPAQAK